MSLIDNIKETPKWIWLAGGGLFIGLIALTRGGGSTTLPGLGQSSDLTDAIAGLKDSINNGGAGTTPPSGGNTGGTTTTPHPPIPGSAPGVTRTGGHTVIGIGHPGYTWKEGQGYVMDATPITPQHIISRGGIISLADPATNRVAIEARTVYSDPGSGTVGVKSLPPVGISSPIPTPTGGVTSSSLLTSLRTRVISR